MIDFDFDNIPDDPEPTPDEPVDLGIDTSPRGPLYPKPGKKPLIVHDDSLVRPAPQPVAKPAESFDLSSLYQAPAAYQSQPLYTPPPKGFIARFMGALSSKFGASILVAIIFALIKELGAIRKAISFTCAIVLGLFGWKLEPPKEEREEANGLIARAKAVAGIRDDAEPDKPKPAIIEKLEKVKEKAAEPVKEKLEETKAEVKEKTVEAKTAVAETKQEAREKVEEVKDTVTKATDRLANVGSAAAGGALAAGRAVRNGVNNAGQALAQASEGYDERQKWWHEHGPTGSCPHCRKPTSIPRRSHGRYRCGGCGLSIDADDARRMGAPSMPFNFQIPPEKGKK